MAKAHRRRTKRIVGFVSSAACAADSAASLIDEHAWPICSWRGHVKLRSRLASARHGQTFMQHTTARPRYSDSSLRRVAPEVS